MSPRRLAPALPLAALLSVPATAHAAPDPADLRVISPDHPWAKVVEGELSKTPFERMYGAEAEAARLAFPSFVSDGAVYDRDSWSATMFETLDLPPPLHAENYEPTVGVLYVALDGVTLSPTCGNGDGANAALNCSPLVDSVTTFPGVSEPSASALFQQLQQFYAPFNLVMTANRPPEYLPYTMAVVGGSAGQAGQSGACGVANVACDGLKRNHVSLTFPQSCGASANTAAQETAHNWGLEHTTNTGDLMYPYNQGGGFQQFVDGCMGISHATGSGVTQCSYIHEDYCPSGGGEQQNSYAELMAAFGPRQADTEAPQIVSISPADGSVFTPDDHFLVTADITDDSRMVGVRWTWLEGLPEDTDSYDKCTNNVCDADFNPGVSFDVGELNWDFIQVDGPPEGTYRFRLEVIDAYGNADSQEVTYTVSPSAADGGDGADDGASDGAADGADGTDGGTDGGADDAGDDGQADGGDGADDGADDGSGSGSESGVFADGGDGGSGKACACRTGRDRAPWSPVLWLSVALLACRRRPTMVG